jgi:hypothetical protein
LAGGKARSAPSPVAAALAARAIVPSDIDRHGRRARPALRRRRGDRPIGRSRSDRPSGGVASRGVVAFVRAASASRRRDRPARVHDHGGSRVSCAIPASACRDAARARRAREARAPRRADARFTRANAALDQRRLARAHRAAARSHPLAQRSSGDRTAGQEPRRSLPYVVEPDDEHVGGDRRRRRRARRARRRAPAHQQRRSVRLARRRLDLVRWRATAHGPIARDPGDGVRASAPYRHVAARSVLGRAAPASPNALVRRRLRARTRRVARRRRLASSRFRTVASTFPSATLPAMASRRRSR